MVDIAGVKEVAEQGGPFVLQVARVLCVEQLKTVGEKVGAKVLASYRDPVSVPGPGHTSLTQWVLVTQGQMSALHLAHHHSEELSGWSASCRHRGVSLWPEAPPTLPSQGHRLAGLCHL